MNMHAFVEGGKMQIFWDIVTQNTPNKKVVTIILQEMESIGTRIGY